MSDFLEREEERLRRHMMQGGGNKPAAKPLGTSSRNQKLCHVCGKPVYVLESVETELGLFHTACFKCKSCGLTLALGSFVCVDGEVYCRRHGAEVQSNLPRNHKVSFTPTSGDELQTKKATISQPRPPTAAPTGPVRVCVGCGQNIRGGESWNTACGGKTWHSRCFVCTQCRKPLSESLFEQDGKPYCSVECVSKAAGTMCVRCGQPIVGEDCLLLGGDESRPCHSACYTCEGCGVSLADVDCYEIAGRSLCQACAVKASS